MFDKDNAKLSALENRGQARSTFRNCRASVINISISQLHTLQVKQKAALGLGMSLGTSV